MHCGTGVGWSDGVYWVAHHTPTGYRLTTLEEFMAGRPLLRIERPIDPPHVVLARVERELATGREYDLLRNNCQHACSRVATGHPRGESRQLAALAGIGLAALGIAALFTLADG